MNTTEKWVYYVFFAMLGVSASSIPYILSSQPTTLEHYIAGVNALAFGLGMICLWAILHIRWQVPVEA